MGELRALTGLLDEVTDRQPGVEGKSVAARWNGMLRPLGSGERADPAQGVHAEVMAYRTSRGVNIGRDDLRRQIRGQLRRIFLLVDEFFLLGKFGSGRRRMELLVQDLIARARDFFVFAAALHPEFDAVSPEHERCVDDLEDFLHLLRSEAGPTMLETLHAMDSLIVHCVLLDAAQSDTALTGLVGSHDRST